MQNMLISIFEMKLYEGRFAQSVLERPMMTENNRKSAKIYQFPESRRKASAGAADRTSPDKDLNSRAVKVVASSGWYHEAAIEDAINNATAS